MAGDAAGLLEPWTREGISYALRSGYAAGTAAATGRLDGCVRAVSDTPERTLGPLAHAVTPDGRPRLTGLAAAFVHQPRATLRALADVRRALRSLPEAFAGSESL